MGFFESVKKKAVDVLSGEHPGVQKHSGGGRRIGSMGKYGGGGAGIDASTYKPDYKPSGHVGSFEKTGVKYGGYDAVTKKASAPERKPAGLGGFGGKVVSKAKAGFNWMAERGHELNESPAYERKEHRKGRRGPRMSREDERLENMYDPLMNERSAPRRGGGGGGNWISQGTIFSGGEAYEEVKPRPKRRKQKSKRARVYEDEEEGGFTNMGHIPSSLRGLF